MWQEAKPKDHCAIYNKWLKWAETDPETLTGPQTLLKLASCSLSHPSTVWSIHWLLPPHPDSSSNNSIDQLLTNTLLTHYSLNSLTNCSLARYHHTPNSLLNSSIYPDSSSYNLTNHYHHTLTCPSIVWLVNCSLATATLPTVTPLFSPSEHNTFLIICLHKLNFFSFLHFFGSLHMSPMSYLTNKSFVVDFIISSSIHFPHYLSSQAF